MEYVRIPQRRIGVLIGSDGATRKEFEEATGCTLEIDSRTGIVHVTIPEGGDALLGLQLLSVVRAIGRGFSPEVARDLLDPETYLVVVDIRDHTGHSRRKLERMRGMVWTGDTNINIWLIRNGWSFYLLENEPPLEHKDLLAAENEAKQLKVGLWKAELQ